MTQARHPWTNGWDERFIGTVQRAQHAGQRLDERRPLGVERPDIQQFSDEFRGNTHELGKPAGVERRCEELLAERLVPPAAAPALATWGVVVHDHAGAKRRRLRMLAHGDDLAAQLMTKDSWQFARDPVVTDVGAADSARDHLHDDLARASSGCRGVVEDDLAQTGGERDLHCSIHAIVSLFGGCATPHSVTSAVTSDAGVTSKAGLRTIVPGSVVATPANCRTSSAPRSSISIASPLPSRPSIDEVGPATTKGMPAACAASASG